MKCLLRNDMSNAIDAFVPQDLSLLSGLLLLCGASET
jgi:hypothetical protein